VPLGHREQFVAGKAAWFGLAEQCLVLLGLHPAVAPGTGAVLQGEAAGP
jgi:hypothetical protein